MTSPSAHEPLNGINILLVEDSWPVAIAMKRLLQTLAAYVTGPVATVAEAESLLSEHSPEAVLVDINLRGGELAYGLIDRLHHQGVHVVVTTGYAVLPLATKAVVLHKPVKEAQLLEALRPVTTQKAAR